MGNAARLAFLAISEQQVGEVGFVEAVDQVGRALALRRHTHVERSFAHEGEASVGLIELHRGDAEIEHDAIDRSARELIELSKSTGYEAEATREFRLERPCERLDVGVPIESDHGGASLEQRARIAARSKRAIEDAHTVKGSQSGK